MCVHTFTTTDPDTSEAYITCSQVKFQLSRLFTVDTTTGDSLNHNVLDIALQKYRLNVGWTFASESASEGRKDFIYQVVDFNDFNNVNGIYQGANASLSLAALAIAYVATSIAF